MHFPRHWAKATVRTTDADGRAITRVVWGWSEHSRDDAFEVAEQRGRHFARATSATDGRAGAYGYPDRPLREPVLRTLADGASGLHAVVSRNSYGCDVLNTDRLVFIDVDLPPPPTPGFFAAIFGGKKTADEALIRVEAEKIALLENWQRAHPACAFRVYRTAAGLRYALTSALLAPDDPCVDELMTATGADADYRRLCRAQMSFRARLTPKPWRCGADKPPHRFPFVDARQAAAMEQWHAGYTRLVAGHAVCVRLFDVGSAPVASVIGPILAEHDRLTRTAAALPLA